MPWSEATPTAGGVTANHIARWDNCDVQAPCTADLNDNGAVDVFDLLILLSE